MSLATRCTQCGTVFRVVQDQLKVSEGWVRCGRCNQVFNALEALFDLDRDAVADTAPSAKAGAPELPSSKVTVTAAPTPTPTPTPAPGPQAVAARALPPAQAFDDIDLDVGTPGASDPLYEPFEDTSTAARLPLSESAYAGHPSTPFREPLGEEMSAAPSETVRRSTPAARVKERDRLEFPDARFDSELPEELAPAADTGTPDLVAQADPAELPAPEAVEPHFVLHAQRRAHWQSPKMLALQGAAVGLLLIVLGLQYAHHFRDQLAARWPSLAPTLAAWCSAASCTLEPPRRIDDLVVETTALARAPLPDAFKLSVVLRNKGSVAVMPPSIDLSLTDVAGQPVLRRVLSPGDFQAPADPLKPGLEDPWQVVLVTAAASRVTGYTVEVFYP